MAKASKQRSRKWIVWALVGIVVLSALGLVGYTVLNNNRNIYELKPKSQLKNDLEKALESQKLPGELIYSKLKDDGCKTNGVGLASYYDCSFTLEKYYKNNASIRPPASTELQNPGSPNIISFIENFKGFDPARTQRNYFVLPIGKLPNIENEDHTLRLNQDEYIAGWQYKITYWYCSEESLFQLPCSTH